MNVRKLLDWRKVLIYVHRWMGVLFGIVFITWFVSGVAFMYVGMPQLSVTERLGHMKPVDPSAIHVSPGDAARENLIDTDKLKIETYYDGRPIYRFAGDIKVYADTGELVSGALSSGRPARALFFEAIAANQTLNRDSPVRRLN